MTFEQQALWNYPKQIYGPMDSRAKECWRLQGWGFMREDGSWDDTAYEKAEAAGVSVTQLYKQAGNGCSANVVMAIGLKLKELEENEEK